MGLEVQGCHRGLRAMGTLDVPRMGWGLQGCCHGWGDMEMLCGMGATGNVGRGWSMLPWGRRVVLPLGAGGYGDAAVRVPPARLPVGCSTVLALHAGNRGDLDCPSPRGAWEGHPSPLPGILEGPHSAARVP